MDWIPFSERLPDVGQLIIAFKTPYPYYYWKGVYKQMPDERIFWFDFWMPFKEIQSD